MKYLALIFLTLTLILPSAFTQDVSTKLKLSVDFGEDVDSTTATVTKLLVAVGDSVNEGQILLELSTGESIQEVVSPLSAKIAELHITEGDEVTANQELVTIEFSTEVAEEGVTAETEATEGVIEEVTGMEAAEEEVTEEVSEEAETVEEEMTDVAEEVVDTTEEATEEISEEAETVEEEMTDVAEETVDATEEAAEEISEEAEAVEEEVTDVAEEAADATEEATEEISEEAEAVEEEVTDVAEEAADATEEATEEISEEAGAVEEEATDVAEEAADATEEATEEISEEEAAEETSEEATNTDIEEANGTVTTIDVTEEIVGLAPVTPGIEETEQLETTTLEDKGSIEEIDNLKTSETSEANSPEMQSIAVEGLAQITPADAILTLGFKPQTPEGDSLWQDLVALDWSGAITTLNNLGLFMSDANFFEFLPYEAEQLMEELLNGIEEGVEASEGLEEAINEVFEFCPALAEVDWENFSPIGKESLVTVGMNPFNPEPAITIMMLMGDDQAAAAQEIQQAFLGCVKEEIGEDMLELEEEGTTLYVLDDGGDFPVIISSVGNAHFLSSNVDTARTIVRLANGTDEPSLASTDLQQRRSAVLAEGGLSFSLDLAAAAEVLSAFKGAIVQDEMTEYLFDRGVAALNTLGGMASNLSITPEGILSESMLATNPEGGDSDLAELLLCESCTVSVPEFAPQSSISLSSSSLVIEEFFAYLQTWLDGLAPYIGEMNINDLAMTVGIDLDLLLGWLGKEVQVVSLEPLSQRLSTLIYQPASAFIFPVESVEAAEEGRAAWASLWPIMKMGLELMDDEDFPNNIFDYAASDTYKFEGVTIERYRFSVNVDIAVAYIDNNLIFASPPDAMHTLIKTANGDIKNILKNNKFSAVYEALPESASGFSFSKSDAHTRAYANLLNLFSQPLAFFIKVMVDAALEETVGTDYSFDVEEEPLFTSPYVEEDLSNVEITPFDLAASEGISGNLVSVEESTDDEDLSIAYYELTGFDIGDTVAATLASEDFDTYLTLIATTEEGREVILENDDFDGSYSESQVAFTAQEGVLEYVVKVSSYEGAGNYSLSVDVAEAPSFDFESFAPYPSEFTDEATNRVAVGEAVEGELQTNETAVLADYFELGGLNVGDEVTVNLSSTDFDTYLYIIDATNESYIAENDDFDNSYEVSQVSFTVQEGTTYLVKATSFDGSGEGDYELTISASSGSEIADTETSNLYEDTEELSPEDMRELAPNFAEILNLTEIIPQAILVLADHLGYSDGHVVNEDNNIYSRSLIRIIW